MPLTDFTNLNNYNYVIDPTSIFAVNVMPGPAGQHTTFVWKIMDVAQPVTGAPTVLLNRYSLTSHFVQLTSPVGELWVRADSISAFHAPFQGDHAPTNVHCMLSVGGSSFTALEDVQTVRQRINAVLGP